jgi:hypothetical protein
VQQGRPKHVPQSRPSGTSRGRLLAHRGFLCRCRLLPGSPLPSRRIEAIFDGRDLDSARLLSAHVQQVRSGLPAGGNEIRTLGPPQKGYAYRNSPVQFGDSPQRAKPVPSEQEPPVPCVSAPNQDHIGKDDNVLISDTNRPAPLVRCSFLRHISMMACVLWGSRFGAETHPNGELPSDPSTDRLTTTDQTPKLCKKPCRSSSSLRVLRRQGAAKHKRR